MYDRTRLFKYAATIVGDHSGDHSRTMNEHNLSRSRRFVKLSTPVLMSTVLFSTYNVDQAVQQLQGEQAGRATSKHAVITTSLPETEEQAAPERAVEEQQEDLERAMTEQLERERFQ